MATGEAGSTMPVSGRTHSRPIWTPSSCRPVTVVERRRACLLDGFLRTLEAVVTTAGHRHLPAEEEEVTTSDRTMAVVVVVVIPTTNKWAITTTMDVVNKDTISSKDPTVVATTTTRTVDAHPTTGDPTIAVGIAAEVIQVGTTIRPGTLAVVEEVDMDGIR